MKNQDEHFQDVIHYTCIYFDDIVGCAVKVFKPNKLL